MSTLRAGFVRATLPSLVALSLGWPTAGFAFTVAIDSDAPSSTDAQVLLQTSGDLCIPGDRPWGSLTVCNEGLGCQSVTAISLDAFPWDLSTGDGMKEVEVEGRCVHLVPQTCTYQEQYVCNRWCCGGHDFLGGCLGYCDNYCTRDVFYDCSYDTYYYATVSDTIDLDAIAPVAAPDAFSVNEDGMLEVPAPGVLANDSDTEGRVLTAIMVSHPAHAQLGLGANGFFAYVLFRDYAGPDSFSYKVSDGIRESDTVTVNITVNPVNDAPALQPIGAKTVEERASLSFTVAATDVEGDDLTYEVSGAPAGASFDPATGRFEWTPGCTAAGEYRVAFQATDDGVPALSSIEEEVTITVTPANCPPAIAQPTGATAVEGEPSTFAVLAADPDGDSLAFSLDAAPPGATIDAATGVFSWVPSLSQAGTHDVTVSAADPHGARDTATFPITVLQPGGAVFTDDFTHGNAAGDPDWTIGAGKWVGGAGTWTAQSTRGTNLSRVTMLDPETFPLGAGVVSARMKLTSTASSAGPNALLLFGYRDSRHYRWVKLTPTRIMIGQTGVLDGIAAGTKASVRKQQRVGRWTSLSVRIAQDGMVEVFRGTATTPVASCRFAGAAGPSVVSGGIGVATVKAKSVFDDVKVWEDSAVGP